jgi:hypothetical protein
MADNTQTTTAPVATTNLVVPDEVTKQFPDLVELIKASRSMDEKERQYWVDVLPIMSEDQIKNLRDILDNEKKQTEEANKSYTQGMKEATKKVVVTFDEAAYKEKKRMRLDAEKAAETEETKSEEQLLQELTKM